MSWLSAIIIGLVQGATECLPVSSSGHLVLAERMLGIAPSGVALEVFLHLGTLGAIVLFYRRRWAALVSRPHRPDSLRLIALLAVATLPAAAAGLIFHEFFLDNFHNPTLVCADLMASGIFLVIAGRRRPGEATMGARRALAVGLAQAAAILPGVSRSGATVGTGLLAGLKREEAFEFSFMMAVPVIIGAALVDLEGIGAAAPEIGRGALIAGCIASFVSGYVAISLFLAATRRGKLSYFGYYCLAAGAAGMIWI